MFCYVTIIIKNGQSSQQNTISTQFIDTVEITQQYQQQQQQQIIYRNDIQHIRITYRHWMKELLHVQIRNWREWDREVAVWFGNDTGF